VEFIEATVCWMTSFTGVWRFDTVYRWVSSSSPWLLWFRCRCSFDTASSRWTAHRADVWQYTQAITSCPYSLSVLQYHDIHPALLKLVPIYCLPGIVKPPAWSWRLSVGPMSSPTDELVVPWRHVPYSLPRHLVCRWDVRSSDAVVRGKRRPRGGLVPQSNGGRRKSSTISLHARHLYRHQRRIDVHSSHVTTSRTYLSSTLSVLSLILSHLFTSSCTCIDVHCACLSVDAARGQTPILTCTTIYSHSCAI